MPPIVEDVSSDESEYGHDDGKEKAISISKFRCFQKRKHGYPTCLIYPDDSFQGIWDIYIAVILVFSCMTVPYRLALIEEDSIQWVWLNGLIDVCFLLDIIIILNKPIFDENYFLVTNRKIIAKQYI